MSNYMDRMVSPGAWDVTVILSWVLVVAVIVALAVLAYSLLARGAGPGPGAADPRATSKDATALGTLEQRYAAGQIDDEEFQRRRETLVAGRNRST